MPEMLQTAPCNLCGGTRAVPLFVKFGYQIVRCADCSLEFLHPMPTAADIAAFYDRGYFTGDPQRRGYLDYVGERETFLRSFAEKLDKIEKMLALRRARAGGASSHHKRLLDVGTAAGFCVEAARERGWDAWGVEVSEYAVAEARERGLNVVQGDSLASFAGQKFDVITLWDALEHLLDPLSSLREATTLLADDGVLVFSTGDIGHFWSRLQGRQHRIYNPPQHLYYFTRATMTKIAEKAGLGVLKIEADEKVTNLHYVLHIARNLVDFKVLSWMFNLLMRITPNFRLRMKLVDNLVVYATPQAFSSRDTPSARHAAPRGNA